jgi:soluble cytochrome b562
MKNVDFENPKKIRKNLFHLVFYGEAIDLMNILVNPERSKLAHRVIIFNAKRMVNVIQEYVPPELFEAVFLIMALDPDQKLTLESAQAIEAIMLLPVVEQYLSSNPLSALDLRLMSNAIQVAECKDEFSSNQATVKFTFDKINLSLSSHPRDNSVERSIKGSALVFAIDISRFDDFSHNDGLNHVISQIHELQKLISTGCFDEVILALKDVKKFSAKLGQIPLAICFDGDDVPTTSNLVENLRFLFDRIPQMLGGNIRVKPLTLDSISVEKDEMRFRLCLKELLTARFIDEVKRLKKAKNIKVAASVAGGAIAAAAAALSVADKLGGLAEWAEVSVEFGGFGGSDDDGSMIDDDCTIL